MIVVRISEGLGNQMFRYAYAYALYMKGIESGIKVYIDIRENTGYFTEQRDMLRKIKIESFPISIPIATPDILKKWNYLKQKNYIHKFKLAIQKYRLGKYKVFYENDNRNYLQSKLEIDDYTYIDGGFQSEKYFIDYRKELIKEFSYNLKLPKEISCILDHKNVVSIHVRRGDYIANRLVRRVLYICDEKYYNSAIEYIKTKVDNPYFFVFSDDIKWVKSHIDMNDSTKFISSEYSFSDIEEMILMSLCKHNIIANSTFSWWAAWLNQNKNKIVVAPKKWFREYGRENIASSSWKCI